MCYLCSSLELRCGSHIDDAQNKFTVIANIIRQYNYGAYQQVFLYSMLIDCDFLYPHFVQFDFD